MPLPPPDDKKPWPPADWQPVFAKMRQWSAWHQATLESLQAAYGGGDQQDDTGFFASDHGGFLPTVGRALRRTFVGEPTRGPERNTKVPIPIGAEICRATADLLFSESPQVTMGAKERRQVQAKEGRQKAIDAAKAHEAQAAAHAAIAQAGAKALATAASSPPKPPAPTAGPATPAPAPAAPTSLPGLGAPPIVPPEQDPGEKRMQELLDDNFWTRIAEAAELGSALGGTYLRTTWDPDRIRDRPFTTIKDSDTAIPTFRWGQLESVLFWRIMKREKDGRQVWRHLELHEMRDTEQGRRYVIQHGLYLGDDAVLGDLVPLDSLPELKPIADNPDLGLGNVISTPFDRLMIVYVPNLRPNAVWRTSLVARDLGRSDLAGIEHLMDQLSEVMSAWLRAIRLSKARIFLNKGLLKNAGPGQGVVADLDQEAYTTLEGLAGKDVPLAQQIQLLQPLIHFEQYHKTAEALLEQIVLMAGFSAQTFGIGDTGNLKTATEIEARERRTLLTRDRKIQEWRPALELHIENLMLADAEYFSGPGVTGTIEVDFTDGVQETPLALAQTALALFQSQSASLVERVRALHPGWDEDTITREVQAIQDEEKANAALTLPPGLGFGGGMSGQPDGQSGSGDGGDAGN